MEMHYRRPYSWRGMPSVTILRLASIGMNTRLPIRTEGIRFLNTIARIVDGLSPMSRAVSCMSTTSGSGLVRGATGNTLLGIRIRVGSANLPRLTE